MSNTAVGQLYKRIIDAVVESSRTDFEENGVEASTLNQLQQSWQNRLTATHRATFPWDPESQQRPQPTSTPAPTIPSNTARNGGPGNVSQQQLHQQQQPPHSNNPNADGVNIKQEGGQGFDTGFLNLPHTGSAYGSNSAYAQQRAAHLIHQQFGTQGQNSIGALQNGIYQQRPPQVQQPNQGQSPQNSQVKTESKPPVQNSQTDGAGDDPAEEWGAVVMRRNAVGEDEPMGRIAADGFIRRQVEAMSNRLEAGGLMVPLDERYPKTTQIKAKSRRARHISNPSSRSRVRSDNVPQYDGVEEDSDDDAKTPPLEEKEEDAINSDLDDSDDGLGEGIEESHEGDVILCLYDKVQRVKNKWKCTLKDGVVTVDGKDYVFHKAQGEFEW